MYSVFSDLIFLFRFITLLLIRKLVIIYQHVSKSMVIDFCQNLPGRVNSGKNPYSTFHINYTNKLFFCGVLAFSLDHRKSLKTPRNLSFNSNYFACFYTGFIVLINDRKRYQGKTRTELSLLLRIKSTQL